MNNFSMLIGSLMSVLGMGSGLASQGLSIRQQLHPQAYNQPATPGQQCMLQRGSMLTPGTFTVVEHADGSKTLECVTSVESQR